MYIVSSTAINERYQAMIARDGWAVLASAHDSVTGRMVGVAPQAGIFLVYES